MKKLILVILWTILFVLSGVIIHNKATTFSKKYNNDMDKIEQHLYNDNWEEAENVLNKSLNSWKKESNIWYFILNHDQLDNISLHFDTIKQGIKIKDKPLCIEQMELLKRALHYLIDGEEYDLKHII